MTIERVLIVDDETIMRNFLAETLRRKGMEVFSAENGKSALKLFKDKSFDLVISDLNMPDMTGIEVLKKVKEKSPETIFIIITAFGSIENTVEAMKLGAFNYLIKPFSPDTIEAVLDKAEEHQSLLQENQYFRENFSPGTSNIKLDKVIAFSPVMKDILGKLKKVAHSNATVMITGESGTGKEVISHFIHTHSQRNCRSYIRVNCAAIPENLIESEFFGHEKGAFTGAHAKRTGRFELAHNGTLLLDEITEVPMLLQPKLLRVIQEKEFERVGGSKACKVDVRLIATSNRNMSEAIDNKLFREDLFYRLNVIPIHLPPLRERVEDIVPLAEYFLAKFCVENHKNSMRLSSSAKKKLKSYYWPGNIRELGNIIERAVVLGHDENIEEKDIFLETSRKLPSLDNSAKEFPDDFTGLSLQEIEKRFIMKTLKDNDNNRTKSSKTLGISVRTLRNKLNEYK
jgi:two-component system, NtrC family, response regulator AtoC